MQKNLLAFAIALSSCGLAHGQESCGAPSGRDCMRVRATPGCSDASCCSAICALDPFCGQVEWDYICRQSAVARCSPPAAINDTMDTAILIQTGSFEVCTIGATNGTEIRLPAGCGGMFGNDITHDVWFRFVATHTGRAIVSSCPATHPGNSAEFDSIILLRTASGAVLGCSDETLGCGGYAEVDVPITAGNTYLVQVGGHDIYVGFGSFSLDQRGVLAPPSCPADLTANDVVNAQDLSIMLSGWGTASGDVTGDGLTNALDLATLLGAWGTCP